MNELPRANEDDDDDDAPTREAQERMSSFGPVGRGLFRSRQVPVFGVVDQALAARVISHLLALEAEDPEAPITMILNSPGGSVTDGFAIYDAMRFIRPEIRVVCVGLAASIATIVLLGAPKEWRTATPSTKLLIHQVYIPGVVRGQASDLEITAKNLMQTRDRINTLLAEATGQPLSRIERDTNRDYWMTAQEAVEYGLISKVVSDRSDLG